MCTLKKCKFELQSKVIIKKQKYMSGIQLLKINDFKNVQVDEQFYTNTIQNHLKSHHSRIEKPHKHNFYAVFLLPKVLDGMKSTFRNTKSNPVRFFFYTLDKHIVGNYQMMWKAICFFIQTNFIIWLMSIIPLEISLFLNPIILKNACI